MWRGVKNIIFILIVSGLFSSCEFRKIEKSEDWRVKYEAALGYYETEDYYKASVLFEQIMPIVRGLPEGEEVQFKLAYCQYYQGLNVMAAHYFKTFFETYGRSTKVEESRYMHAYALYADSPKTSLDQSSTSEAIEAMQNFINKYPNSEFSTDAGTIISEMQVKLEQKGYDNAFQYYKLKMWSAAVVALENFSYDFPDSKLNEEALYYRIMAQFTYADQSILSKQNDRFKIVTDLYEKFIDRYPQSKYIRELEKLYEKSLSKLETIAIK